MYVAPRDLARFGHLYMSKGKLEGDRIVPRRWTRKTTRTNVRGGSAWGSLESWGYGHWWGTGKAAGVPRMYFALGYGGQFIVNVPKLQLTIVATADGSYQPDVANEHEVAILGLIVDWILVPLSQSPVME